MAGLHDCSLLSPRFGHLSCHVGVKPVLEHGVVWAWNHTAMTAATDFRCRAPSLPLALPTMLRERGPRLG